VAGRRADAREQARRALESFPDNEPARIARLRDLADAVDNS
jgi:hypothetical protein